MGKGAQGHPRIPEVGGGRGSEEGRLPYILLPRGRRGGKRKEGEGESGVTRCTSLHSRQEEGEARQRTFLQGKRRGPARSKRSTIAHKSEHGHRRKRPSDDPQQGRCAGPPVTLGESGRK